ncbi:DUF1993 domain-containing protein [Methylomonas fluvii]|uniref:DUF1993 domain-containing protein n=1 Tax=Methylomonas fluvii TaxID=1854564 RepID=A0ABR9DF87_9GAMM|nr:DUF1993 domain-containing protein [Methylomonas fluvii]MBD9361752.1 DUF1993 domain-containing protein [Methylomonas fluvii]CAD6874759.1 hypothetical protein [Methylomonas fluvii]
MSLSMYAITVLPMAHSLTQLQQILEKAAAYAEAKKIEPSVLVNARLFPDMYPLKRQVQIASDVAKGAVSRLAGQEPPKFEDNENSFPDLIERIDKTLAHINSFNANQIDGTEGNTILLPRHDRTSSFTGLAYVTDFVLPNVYFHVTTTYAILRHNGLEIGKKDYLGDVG